MPSTFPKLTDRPSLKLYTAKIAFTDIRYLHDTKGSLVSSEARLPTEIEIYDFLSSGQRKICIASENK